MTPQLIPADPLVRTRAILTAALTLALGFGALVYTQAYFDSMLELRGDLSAHGRRRSETAVPGLGGG